MTCKQRIYIYDCIRRVPRCSRRRHRAAFQINGHYYHAVLVYIGVGGYKSYIISSWTTMCFRKIIFIEYTTIFPYSAGDNHTTACVYNMLMDGITWAKTARSTHCRWLHNKVFWLMKTRPPTEIGNNKNIYISYKCEKIGSKYYKAASFTPCHITDEFKWVTLDIYIQHLVA